MLVRASRCSWARVKDMEQSSSCMLHALVQEVAPEGGQETLQ